jgi:hypothetical protein
MTKLIVAFRNFVNAPSIISCPIGNRTTIPLFARPRLIQYIDSSSRQVILKTDKLPAVAYVVLCFKEPLFTAVPLQLTFLRLGSHSEM